MEFVPKILIISNQQATLPLWSNLLQQRLKIIIEKSPENALKSLAQILPDLIVLDLKPEALVLRLLQKLREEAVMPILLLTEDGVEKFLLEAYKSGVDECILKPISPPLFQAKLMAWLLRSSSVPVNMLHSLRVGEITLVPSERIMLLANHDPVHLTNLELRLLYYLMVHPDRTVTVDELCQRLWGYEGHGNAGTLKNIVYRLRRKIEDDPSDPYYIRNVPGIGYRFVVK